MATLSTLPAEVLGEILSRKAHSFLFIALWKCGDRQLQQKLAQGVTFVHLRDKWVESTSRYPKLLSKLTGLRHLSLNRGKHPLMASAADLSAELRNLTCSKLQTLRITSFEANEAFLNFDTSVQPPKVITTTYAFGESRFFDMATHFPSLATLRIDSKDLSKSDVEESDLPGLPPTLTCLCTPNFQAISPTRRVCATLPRQLQVWDAKISFLNSTDGSEVAAADLPHFWEDAPPSLRTLTAIYIERHTSMRTLKHIPRTLVDCQITSEPVELSLQLQRELPPQISSLSTSILDYDVLMASGGYLGSDLPKQIKSLGISGANSFCAVLPTLPSTLTRFWYINTRVKEVIDAAALKDALQANARFWPKELTTLGSYRLTASNAILPLLPVNLTALTIHWSENSIPGVLLPPKLVKLSLISETHEPFIVTSRLPSTLEQLELRSTPLDASSFVHFPPSLTALTAKNQGIHQSTPDAPLELPSGLLNLSLGDWNTFKVVSLPPGLTVLDLYANPQHSDPIYLEHIEHILSIAPPTITSMTFSTPHAQSIALSGRHFSHLIALNELKLYGMILEPILLKGLPPSIRTIAVNRFANLPFEFSPYINPRWTNVHIIINENDDYINLAKSWPPSANPNYMMPELRQFTEEAAKRANTVALCYPHPSII